MRIEPKYYTVNQLAEYSSLLASTIRRYIRYEGLPHFRMNRRILIRIDEFDEWMNLHRQKRMKRQEDIDRIVRDVLKDFGR